MSGNVPHYSSFGDNIYASDIIVQSIRCKANEFKKLDPRHIRYTDGIKTTVTDSSLARVLRRPNEFMTTADFLEKITILRELSKNAFIYTEFYKTKGGERYYTGLYPLKPSYVEMRTNDAGALWYYFRFANGHETEISADYIVHWRKDFGVNDYFGGSAYGGNDDQGLLTTLQRYDQLTQSIAKALNVSCNVNAIVQYNTYGEDEALKAERVAFEAAVKENESGILFTDNKFEYSPISRDIKLVDAETLKFFYDTILRANGTPLCILNGDYTKAQKEAYYEHSLEADIKGLGQAFTKTVFSDRAESFGNEIEFFPNKINFMSMENKIAALQVGVPSGTFMKDEIRELLGYPPLPNGQGQVIAQGYNNLLDSNNKNTLQETE